MHTTNYNHLFQASAIAGIFFGVVIAFAAPPKALAAPIDVPFTYRGTETTWTVPAGITSLSVQTWGAAGGLTRVDIGGWGSQWAFGGGGGYASGILKVTPGQKLTIIVGQGGRLYNLNVGSLQTFGGGGNQGVYGRIYAGRAYDYYFGSGGGRSAVRIGTTEVVTAGGGGGGGAYGTVIFDSGGGGGGGSGQGTKRGALGGTQQAAGQGGSKYTGGNGFLGGGTYGGGGGGGGYYGGGATPQANGGGGGGSAHCDTNYVSGCRMIGSTGNTSGGKNEDNYISGIGYSNICLKADYNTGNCIKWESSGNPAGSQGNGLIVITYDPCPTDIEPAQNNASGFWLRHSMTRHLASFGFDECLINTSGNDYYIPAKIKTELQSFFSAASANKVPGVTVF